MRSISLTLRGTALTVGCILGKLSAKSTTWSLKTYGNPVLKKTKKTGCSVSDVLRQESEDFSPLTTFLRYLSINGLHQTGLDRDRVAEQQSS